MEPKDWRRLHTVRSPPPLVNPAPDGRPKGTRGNASFPLGTIPSRMTWGHMTTQTKEA